MWTERAIEAPRLHRSGTIAEESRWRIDDGSHVIEGHGRRMAHVSQSVETTRRMFGCTLPQSKRFPVPDINKWAEGRSARKRRRRLDNSQAPFASIDELVSTAICQTSCL